MTTRVRYPKKRPSPPLAFQGPKGICLCGHTGNGSDSQHSDTHFQYNTESGGNGACTITDCDCRAYAPARRTPEFEVYCHDKQHNVP
jgi:hypothetical protein